jgi:hypothetical protein
MLLPDKPTSSDDKKHKQDVPVDYAIGGCAGCLVSPFLYGGLLFIFIKSSGRVFVWDDPMNNLGVPLLGLICAFIGALVNRHRNSLQ